MDLHLFDIIILSFVIVLGLTGLVRGFVKEIFGLIGIIGGVSISSRIANYTGEILNDLISIQNESTRLVIGFIVSLIGIWTIAYLLGIIISKLIKSTPLSVFDRLFGFIFASSKIFFILSVLIYSVSNITTMKITLDKKNKDSFMYPLLKNTGSYIIKIDTSKLQKKIKDTEDSVIKTVKKKLDNTTIQKSLGNITTNILKDNVKDLKIIKEVINTKTANQNNTK